MNESRKILIVGDHPIRDCISRQFRELSCDVRYVHQLADGLTNEPWDEIVILSTADPSHQLEADTQAIQTVRDVDVALRQQAARRPVVHLLLHSQETLRLIRTRQYNDEWHPIFELNAFTIEDVWARNVVCPEGGCPTMPGLDYRPITIESNRVVRLVVFGTSPLATSLVENAALVAHYPNYCRNHALRTRITIIAPDIDAWSKGFISRHKSLMDNSFYRHIDVDQQTCDTHRPMYEGQRDDFVDVEWEFVRATPHDVVVQDKLLGWATADDNVLSIALCHESDEDNLVCGNLLADLLHEYATPIYIRQQRSTLSDIILRSPRMKTVRLIGMCDAGYDVRLPLLTMAKRVKYVYDYCYDHNIESSSRGCITAPSYIDDKEADSHWLQEKKAVKRYSSLCNAMTLATKMRSLGHADHDGHTFYAITTDEIAQTARVEHDRWCVEEMLLGFRPCTDEELAAIEADIARKDEFKERLIHYDLVAYDHLRVDATGKNVDTYDLCLSASIPLIAYDGRETSS